MDQPKIFADFFEEINKIHPAIMFTMQHTHISGEDPDKPKQRLNPFP